METIETICKECSSTFLREKKRGRPAVKCMPCKDKIVTVMQFAMKRNLEILDGIIWVQNSEPCRDCSKVFNRPKKKGKPPVRCQSCRDDYEAEKVLKVAVSQETVENAYSGDKKKLLGDPNDRPNGGEFQCPRPRGCGRIFTSDSAAESHKEYDTNGNLKPCKNSALMGMIPIERRGLPIWRNPIDPEALSAKIGK